MLTKLIKLALMLFENFVLPQLVAVQISTARILGGLTND